MATIGLDKLFYAILVASNKDVIKPKKNWTCYCILKMGWCSSSSYKKLLQ